MSDKDWSSRPPTLIPFDAVGVINDLADLAGEQLANQCVAFRMPTGVLYRVRYTTESVETLTNAIGDGCQLVEFALIHPELRVASLTDLPDGRRTRIQWEPELPELETYELQRWDKACDPQNNCVMFQWMRNDEVAVFKGDDGKTVLIASSVESFIRAVIGETFAGDIEERRRCWQSLQQTWKRFRIRMASGELHWLEVETRNTYTLASLWDDSQQLAAAAEFDNEELPDWCKVESPTKPEMAITVAERLASAANEFGVMWGVESGRATDDLAAIDAGVAVLLPRFDVRNDPDERIGELRNRSLPTSCKFCKVRDVTANDRKLAAECSVCGHRISFRKESLGFAGSVVNIYRKCTPGIVRVCRVKADPDSETVWLDGESFNVLKRSAIFLHSLILNPTRRMSGRQINESFPEFPANKASRYMIDLPPGIRLLIDTNQHAGSILKPDAWRDEPKP